MSNKTIMQLLASGLKLVLYLCMFSTPAYAAIDVYQFSNDTDRERFYALTSELRCPKCQNQNLADSNAPIAQDLRTKIHAMLGEKRSDQEIIDYMIARYGDFVLYQPRVNNLTYILWFGPLVLLMIGVAVVIFISRRNASKINRNESIAVSLDAEQQQKLDAILNDTGKKSS